MDAPAPSRARPDNADGCLPEQGFYDKNEQETSPACPVCGLYSPVEALVGQCPCDGEQGAADLTHEMLLYGLPREEIKSRITDMLKLETRYAVQIDYIAEVQRDGMRPIWRTRLFEWLLEFVHEFNLSVRTIATAMNLVDRYLCKVSTKKGIMQLVALAAVLIANKLHETYPLSIKSLQGLAEGVYLESDIRLMELEMLRVLGWELDPVSPYCFLRYLVLYFEELNAHFRKHVLILAETFLEIVLCEYSFAQFLPSETATASLLCALEVFQLSSSHISKHSLESYQLDADDVSRCKELLLQRVHEIFPELLRKRVVVSPDCVADEVFCKS